MTVHWTIIARKTLFKVVGEGPISRSDVDLVLDVMLPKLDGFEVCRQLREQGARVPILLLTARGGVIFIRDLFRPSTREEIDRLVATYAAHETAMQRQLLAEVWGPTHVDDTHYLRIYMKQLRDKFELDPVQPRHFITETGVGYRLIADD